MSNHMNIDTIGHEVMRISVLLDILREVLSEHSTTSTLSRAYVLTEVIADMAHSLDTDIENLSLSPQA